MSIATTPDGRGYWLVAADGAVYAFGDAPYLGSLPGLHVTPAQPITGMAVTHNGAGYWMVAADGGMYAFGDAPYAGSLPGLGVRVSKPIIGMAPAGNDGYWLFGSDGGTFALGVRPTSGLRSASPAAAPSGAPRPADRCRIGNRASRPDSYSGGQLGDEAIEIRLHGLRQVDPLRVGQPLDLETHEHGNDLARDLLDVDVGPEVPLRPRSRSRTERTSARAVS